MNKKPISPSQYINRADINVRDFDDHWTKSMKINRTDSEIDSSWSETNAYSFKLSYWRSWQKMNKKVMCED